MLCALCLGPRTGPKTASPILARPQVCSAFTKHAKVPQWPTSVDYTPDDWADAKQLGAFKSMSTRNSLVAPCHNLKQQVCMFFHTHHSCSEWMKQVKIVIIQKLILPQKEIHPLVEQAQLTFLANTTTPSNVTSHPGLENAKNGWWTTSTKRGGLS